MLFKSTIDVLVADACPSIQYRLRTEILGESASSAANRKLQKQILDDPLVKEVFSWQLPDGHFGRTLTEDMLGTAEMLKIVHGRNGLEQAVKILHEKGVSVKNEHVASALAVVDAIPPKARIDGLLALANAYFGRRERDCSARAVSNSLPKFEMLSKLTAIDEVVGKGKKRVFRRGVLWPDVGDLAVLAHTEKWRNPANTDAVKAAVANACCFYPEPENVSGQFIRWGTEDEWGTYEFVWFKLSPELPGMAHEWTRTWFKNLEHLSRMPFLLDVSTVRPLAESLMSLLDKGDGWFREATDERSYLRWLWAYDGMALEAGNYLKPPYQWHSEDGRIRDLTFRCLLVLHNFGLLD